MIMSLVSMFSKIKDAWLNNIDAEKCPFCGELGLDNFSAHYDEVRGHHSYMLNTCTYCNRTVDLFTGQEVTLTKTGDLVND